MLRSARLDLEHHFDLVHPQARREPLVADLEHVRAQVGEQRKSLAYTLKFRAPDRTLTAAETTAARDAAVAEASRRVGAVLRS